MKQGEKQLLKLMGSGPLVQKHTLPVSIKLYITDVDGNVLDKNNPAIPAKMKVKYPFYLFGEFDRQGGYRIGNRINPPGVGIDYMFTYVNGVGLPFLYFTGFNQIQNMMQLGDLVHTFADDRNNPTYFAFVIISSSTASYASIIQNTETIQNDRRIGQIDIEEVNFFMNSSSSTVIARQIDEDFTYAFIDNTGMYKKDSISSNTFKTPFQELKDFITIDVAFKLDQYILLTSYIDYEINSLEYNFKINK